MLINDVVFIIIENQYVLIKLLVYLTHTTIYLFRWTARHVAELLFHLESVRDVTRRNGTTDRFVG